MQQQDTPPSDQAVPPFLGKALTTDGPQILAQSMPIWEVQGLVGLVGHNPAAGRGLDTGEELRPREEATQDEEAHRRRRCCEMESPYLFHERAPSL